MLEFFGHNIVQVCLFYLKSKFLRIFVVKLGVISKSKLSLKYELIKDYSGLMVLAVKVLN